MVLWLWYPIFQIFLILFFFLVYNFEDFFQLYHYIIYIYICICMYDTFALNRLMRHQFKTLNVGATVLFSRGVATSIPLIPHPLPLPDIVYLSAYSSLWPCTHPPTPHNPHQPNTTGEAKHFLSKSFFSFGIRMHACVCVCVSVWMHIYIHT